MKLYDFQVEGVKFLLARKRAYLADTMGLGKTVQAVCAALETGSRNTLVVCPAAACVNWHREWVKWGGDPDQVTITSFDMLVRHGVTIPDPDLVIIDEAHYCKTHTAKRTKAALGVARQSPRAWLLSGTPMPNHPGELYAPIAALWPGYLPGIKHTHDQWFDRYCKWYPTEYGKKVYGVKNTDEIRAWQSEAMLRRKVEDVALDLPPLRVDVHQLSLPGALVKGITGGETARERRLLGEFKAPHIAKLIDQELKDGAYPKIVIGAYHHDTIDRLNADLAHWNPLGFTGHTPGAKRQEQIDLFTTSAEHRIFIVQQGAGGIAINLQAAPEVVLVEPDWVPDVNAQFIKRIHRIGSTAPCRARLFTLPGTLDEAIMSSLATKIAMQVEVGLN